MGQERRAEQEPPAAQVRRDAQVRRERRVGQVQLARLEQSDLLGLPAPQARLGPPGLLVLKVLRVLRVLQGE